jgi:ankyrin repeat protein
MVSHGANVDVVNNHGETPLHKAANGWEDCPELCEILLKHKAMIDAVDQDGNQPLHFACLKGHLETVKLMVSHGANVRAVNSQGQTPLNIAASKWKENPEFCETVDKDGNGPLHLACKQGHIETVIMVLLHGANVNAVNKRGQTPLYIAAGGEKDCPELCEILLKHKAKIDAVDEDGCVRFY